MKFRKKLLASIALATTLFLAVGLSTANAATVTGTATLNAGTLSLVNLFPSGLNWSATLTGNNFYLATTGAGNNPPDGQMEVDDATGSGNGWNITVSMNQFCVLSAGACPTTNPQTLPNSNVYVNGHQSTTTNSDLVTTLPTGTTPPYACASGSTCTLPATSSTVSLTYPVNILSNGTSQGTASLVSYAAANSGMGSINIPLDWWLYVPGNALAGTYNSTFTILLNSGP
jgi:hypothetical protein